MSIVELHCKLSPNTNVHLAVAAIVQTPGLEYLCNSHAGRVIELARVSALTSLAHTIHDDVFSCLFHEVLVP